MGQKLFCGGLAWATTSDGLRAAFEGFGEVTEATVVMDRDSGRSRGFGFVTFATEDQARTAQGQMDGTDLDGRTIKVDMAQERGPRPPR